MKATNSHDGIKRYNIKINYRFTPDEYNFWCEFYNGAKKFRNMLYNFGEEDLHSNFENEFERPRLKELSQKHNDCYKMYFQ